MRPSEQIARLTRDLQLARQDLADARKDRDEWRERCDKAQDQAIAALRDHLGDTLRQEAHKLREVLIKLAQFGGGKSESNRIANRALMQIPETQTPEPSHEG